MKKHLVVLTGAGISAESGLKTFRDDGGLWEKHRIEDVATLEAWDRDPETVLRFYNERRMQLANVKPNQAHFLLAELEDKWDVKIVTQNVDDLHERAGSTKVLHLHGELRKVRSSGNLDDVSDIGHVSIRIGDKCQAGFQLRPHIVWFGEAVPMIEMAQRVVSEADHLLIIGTSLNVYPAAGLINDAPLHSPITLIDPSPEMAQYNSGRIKVIPEKATIGMKIFTQMPMNGD